MARESSARTLLGLRPAVAGSALAASQQAPLMAICLVMELADAPINLFVPIGFAVAVSAFTASRLAAPLAALHLPRPSTPVKR